MTEPSVDDPVGRFLAEWRDDPRGSITVRQLLQNVSGLEELPLGAAPLPPEAGLVQRATQRVESLLGKNARLALGTDFAAAALSFGLENEPGARFAFSNANSQLAGLVLERATGMPYETYIEQKLWLPIGAAVGEFTAIAATACPATYGWEPLAGGLGTTARRDDRGSCAGWAELGARTKSTTGCRSRRRGVRDDAARGRRSLCGRLLQKGGGLRRASSRNRIVRLGRAAPGGMRRVPNLVLRGRGEVGACASLPIATRASPGIGRSTSPTATGLSLSRRGLDGARAECVHPVARWCAGG